MTGVQTCALPISFAAYRDLKETVNLGKDVYNLNYNVGEVLGALMHQMNWTEAQARAMMTASETYQIRMAADKLGVDLNDPGAIAAKINSILGTSFTDAQIFVTCPVFVPDPALACAVYPAGSNQGSSVYYDYMFLSYLGSCILIKNYSAQLFAVANPAEVAAILNEFYTGLAQLGVTASTPADAVSGILAKLNADLGLSGSDAYTEANAGTVETMRGDVSQDVKNAVLATFGTDRVNLDTEVRWYYGLNDDDTVGFQSSSWSSCTAKPRNPQPPGRPRRSTATPPERSARPAADGSPATRRCTIPWNMRQPSRPRRSTAIPPARTARYAIRGSRDTRRCTTPSAT